MNRVFCLMLVFALMGFVTPALADEVTQIWHCEMEDDVTEKAIIDGVGEWLEAARQIDGGANLQATVLFPVAVTADDYDAMIIIRAPSFEEWGKFWDGYEGSPAAKLENLHNDIMVCPDAELWESVDVDAKTTGNK